MRQPIGKFRWVVVTLLFCLCTCEARRHRKSVAATPVVVPASPLKWAIQQIQVVISDASRKKEAESSLRWLYAIHLIDSAKLDSAADKLLEMIAAERKRFVDGDTTAASLYEHFEGTVTGQFNTWCEGEVEKFLTRAKMIEYKLGWMATHGDEEIFQSWPILEFAASVGVLPSEDDIIPLTKELAKAEISSYLSSGWKLVEDMFARRAVEDDAALIRSFISALPMDGCYPARVKVLTRASREVVVAVELTPKQKMERYLGLSLGSGNKGDSALHYSEIAMGIASYYKEVVLPTPCNLETCQTWIQVTDNLALVTGFITARREFIGDLPSGKTEGQYISDQMAWADSMSMLPF